MTTLAASDRVAVRNKVGIASAEAGLVIGGVVFNTWSLYFLVNIADVPGWQAGALFLVARLFDAVNDPLIGDFIDRRVDRVPRMQWVKRFCVPVSALLIAVYALPFAPGPALLYLLVALCVSSVFTTFTGTAVISLIPVIARTYDARTSLTGWRVGSGLVVSLVGISAPPVVVLAVTGDSDLAASDPLGWIVMGVLLGVVTLVGLTISLLAVRVPAGGERVAVQRLSRSLLGRLWRLPVFRSVLLIVLVYNIAIIVGTATLPFYLESVLGMDAAQQSIVLGAFFLLTVGSIPLATAAARRLGKTRALAASTGVYCVGLLLFAFVQPRFDQLPQLVLVVLVTGIGFSGAVVLPNAMVPDVAEFIEHEMGERRESLLYTLTTFFVKTGGSVGVALVAGLTSLIGYQSGQSDQSGGTELGLALVIGPFQVALYAVGAVLAWRSPLTRAAFDAVSARVARDDDPPDPPTVLAVAVPPLPVAVPVPAEPTPAPVEVPSQAARRGVLVAAAGRTGLSEGQLQSAVVGLAVAGLLAATGLPPVLRGGGDLQVAVPVQASAPLAAPGSSVLAPAAPPVVPPAVLPLSPDVPATLPVTDLDALAPPPAPFDQPLPPAAPAPAPPAPAGGGSAPAQEDPGGPPVLAGELALADTAWFGADGPELPQGSLPVARSLTGPSRVTVLRLSGPGALLVLPLAEVTAQQVEPVATVLACRVTAPGWQPGPAQPLTAAPAYDCRDGVAGSRGDAGWTFDLSAFPVRAGGAGFALVPGDAPTPFQVTYQPAP